MMSASKQCKFADLPPVAGMPHGCAWNHYHQGDQTQKDQLGSAFCATLTPWLSRAGRCTEMSKADFLAFPAGLNLLTPEVVKRAARSQIQTGLRVQLDWGMHNVQFAGFGRKGFEQKILAKDYGERWLGTDDEVRPATRTISHF